MQRIRTARAAGTAGIIVGALWLASWTAEAIDEAGEGTGLWYAEQILATVALLGTAVLMFGLAALRPAGDGRVARTVLALNWVAWLSLTLGGIGMLATGDEDAGPLGVFFPIGGILGTFTALCGGILVAVRGRVEGWPRWALLVFGAGYLVLGFLQSGEERTAVSAGAELVQYLLLLALAVAVRTASAAPAGDPAPAPASAPVGP